MQTKLLQPASSAEANDSQTASDKAVVCKELLERLAARLERRAREMEKARAFNDEERTQRRCMVVIYMDISHMLLAEFEKLSNDAGERPRT
jgi:hypothetical protein